MRRLCYLLQTLSLNPQGIETQRIFLGASGKQKQKQNGDQGLSDGPCPWPTPGTDSCFRKALAEGHD